MTIVPRTRIRKRGLRVLPRHRYNNRCHTMARHYKPHFRLPTIRVYEGVWWRYPPVHPLQFSSLSMA